MSRKRYKPGTPLPIYPLMGKSTMMLWDMLSRVYGLEVPKWNFKEVSIDELLGENKCHS